MPSAADATQSDRAHDKRRIAEQPWRRWYRTARWFRIRTEQLARKPLCERCDRAGIVAPASVCHHVERHAGDPVKFWRGPFASSCAACHDIDEQRLERGGKARQTVGADGWPM